MKRRRFIQSAAALLPAGSLSAVSASRRAGANERIRVGLIGCGGRGRYVAERMRRAPGVEFAAVCDLHAPNRSRAAIWAGPGARTYSDFRKLLDQKDIDAVLIATPDHWHAIPTVFACEAGKDVYVEKPLAHNVREGQAMVRAARRNNRIVQIGTQHRSAAHLEKVQKIVQSGKLGKVHYVKIWNFLYLAGRIRRQPDSNLPEGLDWDFYLGPAPWVPYNRARFLGTYRWFHDYSGGLITDYGTHRLDSMQQIMGADAPRAVSASGGRYHLDDASGDVPDVMQVTYEYPDFVVNYEACALNRHGPGGHRGERYYRSRGIGDRPHGMAFYGTKGVVFADRTGYEVHPEPPPRNRSARTNNGESPRHSAEDATAEHAQSFISCLRSRTRPAADVAVGHRSTILCHLGNIALKTGRKLEWAADKEEIVGDAAASRMLAREARKPWDLI